MKITKIITGYLEENCYILEIDNNVLIIDPGDFYLEIKKELKGKNVLACLITHYHFDHVGALDNLKKDYDIPIYDYKLKEDNYIIDKFKFSIIKTPGHTDDSITFYFMEDKIMFTGDFIFKESIGRVDLPTGNFNEMNNSINMIKNYDDDIKIYPGHGSSTTLKYEKENNYYFNLVN